jgi:hypothetical protein
VGLTTLVAALLGHDRSPHSVDYLVTMIGCDPVTNLCIAMTEMADLSVSNIATARLDAG